MLDVSRYETIGSQVFKPYLEGKGPVFVLTTWGTFRTDRYGKCILAYRLSMGPPDVVLFEGEDYACSPMHAIDSDECARSLMTFLTLRPGDTDREYFENYTPEQLAYCSEHAEALSMAVMDRYGEET